MTPVETVFATAEPETDPISPEPTTATIPAPPVKRPARQRARLTMKSPAPECSKNEPKIINMKTKVEEVLVATGKSDARAARLTLDDLLLLLDAFNKNMIHFLA